jgi:hypothetical protein
MNIVEDYIFFMVISAQVEIWRMHLVHITVEM